MESSNLSHRLEQRASQTLFMGKRNFCGEQGASSKYKVGSDDAQTGSWESESPVGYIGIDEGEQKRRYAGQGRTDD